MSIGASASGTLAYAPGDATHFQRRLVTLAGGAAQPVIDERRYFDNRGWGRDGQRLYCYRANTIWSAAVGAGEPLAISKPTLVTELPTVRPSGSFDVMPDGRILFVDGRDVGATPELRIVLHWSAELRRLLAAP